MTEISIVLPDGVIEEIAERAAEVALVRIERHKGRSPYLTVSEAAERLRTEPQRIYDLCSSGRLARFKDGDRLLLSRDEIDAYLAGTRQSPIAPRLPRTSQSRSRRGVAA